MTEYWVSKSQYFCKYCNIYIRDDKPSRLQHENGLRHKGNLERYIRQVYKSKASKSREEADEAREIARINAAATAAHALDAPLGPSASGLALRSKDAEGGDGKGKGKERAKAAKWAGGIGNYSDARSLGLVDEEAEQKMLEVAQVAREEGTVGEWQAVIRPPVRRPAPGADDEAVEEEEVDEEERRPNHRTFRERVARPLDDDDEGDGLPEIKLKRPRLDVKPESDVVDEQVKLEDGRAPPVVAPTGVVLPGTFKAFRLDRSNPDEQGTTVKADEPGEAGPAAGAAFDGGEDVKPTVGPVFKKRKAKAATGSARSTRLA